MGNMISNYVERMKAAFVPQVDEQARMAMDGTVCVRTNTANGKEWIGIRAGEKVAYPEETLLEDVPVFTIAKTVDQIKVGDIVKATSSTYAVVEKIEDGIVYNTTFGGNMRKNVPITDFLTKQKTIRVVVNPFGLGGDMNNNMMMLMLLDKKEGGNGDLADVMMLASMMSGQGSANPFGNIMSSPMALMMFSQKDGGSLKDILMMQMIQNGGFFNIAAPAAKTPVAEPKVKAPAMVEAPVAEAKQD